MEQKDKFGSQPDHCIDIVTNRMLEEAPVLCAFRDTLLRQPMLHSHQGYEVYLCIQGAGSFLAGDRVYTLSPGALIIVRPMVLHLSRPDERLAFQRFVLSVDENYMEALLRQDDQLCSGFGRQLKTEDSFFLPPAASSIAMLQDTLYHLEKELLHREPYFEASVKSLLMKCLVDMARLVRFSHGPVRSEAGLTAKVEQILSHIAEHYEDPIHMDEVASRYKLSRSYMYRIFKEYTGYAPNQYLLAFRINKAKALLLHSELSVIEVAARSGFQDVSHFCHTFKKQTRMTPSAFRSLHSLPAGRRE
ncbi:AraC family transcriptional regulator [Paenibacillus silviterrae]|uniref:AraC family transcriptional regulator n=1 Tax=Paenibacillus silviterrae TaxID=3242194 RepID=UPI0025432859|nr:AraC family transcriptional regulator [Paenibacillus chinjuensis]